MNFRPIKYLIRKIPFCRCCQQPMYCNKSGGMMRYYKCPTCGMTAKSRDTIAKPKDSQPIAPQFQ